MPTWTTGGTWTAAAVTVFEHANFGGRSRTFNLGEHRLITPDDLNDAISSIRVPAGFCAHLFEHADEGGGYGRSVDLLEDCADLSQYGFNDITSYVTVFSTTANPGFVWKRAHLQDGQFVGGHWERRRARVEEPLQPATAVVSPPLPPRPPTGPTVMQVDGAQTIITTLGAHTARDALAWEHATADQMGVIGNDFRGAEEIGSAAFERASNNPAIPDFLNFWYPQKWPPDPREPRDHRAVVFSKRTLIGKVENASIANIPGTYKDHDVDI